MHIFHILCYIQRSYGCLKKQGLRLLLHGVYVHNMDVTVMRIIVKIYTDIRKKNVQMQMIKNEPPNRKKRLKKTCNLTYLVLGSPLHGLSCI